MRQLIVWNLVSLDGRFEGPKPWDLAFHAVAWGPELEAMCTELGEEAGLLVFGRKTYEGLASYWTTTSEQPAIKAYMNDLPKLAASRTLTEATWNNTRVTNDAVAELRRAKEGNGKPIFVFGSADLCASLLDAGLVDEVRLCIVPVVLGAGTPLFKARSESRTMKLLASRTLETGAIIARYAP